MGKTKKRQPRASALAMREAAAFFMMEGEPNKRVMIFTRTYMKTLSIFLSVGL